MARDSDRMPARLVEVTGGELAAQVFVRRRGQPLATRAPSERRVVALAQWLLVPDGRLTVPGGARTERYIGPADRR